MQKCMLGMIGGGLGPREGPIATPALLLLVQTGDNGAATCAAALLAADLTEYHRCSSKPSPPAPDGGGGVDAGEGLGAASCLTGDSRPAAEVLTLNEPFIREAFWENGIPADGILRPELLQAAGSTAGRRPTRSGSNLPAPPVLTGWSFAV